MDIQAERIKWWKPWTLWSLISKCEKWLKAQESDEYKVVKKKRLWASIALSSWFVLVAAIFTIVAEIYWA